MKGPQIAALIWLANLLVAAGAAFAGYSYWTDVKEARAVTYDKVGRPKTKEKLIAWKNQADNVDLDGHKHLQDVLLSPQQRPPDVSISPNGGTLSQPTTLNGRGGSGNPKGYQWSIEGDAPVGVSLSASSGRTTMLKFGENTPQESTVTVRASNGETGETATATYTLSFSKPVEVVPSDEQLRTELENWVNQQFTLLRLLYGPPTIAKATVDSKEAGASLIFYAGLKFKETYKDSFDKKIAGLAKHDLEVISIEKDHVLMKGPSRNAKFKDKYFEVQLKMSKEAMPKLDGNIGKSKSGGKTRMPMPEQPLPNPDEVVVDTRPKESFQDDNGNWTLGTEDYKNIDVDELARYAKVVHDREGNPLGIQISDDIPEDNVVLGRGGRRGDIIKAINGQPVKSMSDVRRIVRSQYNAGTSEFIVTYERDGVPGTKVFNVPQKKKKEGG